jgi:Cu/Ag efflux protein CusF
MSRHLLRTAMALGVAALALSFTGFVQAADTSTPTTAAAPAPKPKPHQYTGDVTAIDAKASTVIVKKEGAEAKTFKIGPKTRYSTAEKKDAMLEDIKVGDKVTVWYTEEDGVLTAHRIAPPRSAKKKSAE